MKLSLAAVNEVFQLQTNLALFLFESRNLEDKDTINHLWSVQNDYIFQNFISNKRENWILNFSRALSHELKEAEAVAVDAFKDIKVMDKLKEELIDILHFHVSLCILSGYSTFQFTNVEEINDKYPHFSTTDPVGKGNIVRTVLGDIDTNRVFMETAVNWKWWSNRKEPNLIRIHDCLADITSKLVFLFSLSGLTEAEVVDVYRAKNRKNINRQLDNYVTAEKSTI